MRMVLLAPSCADAKPAAMPSNAPSNGTTRRDIDMIPPCDRDWPGRPFFDAAIPPNLTQSAGPDNDSHGMKARKPVPYSPRHSPYKGHPMTYDLIIRNG